MRLIDADAIKCDGDCQHCQFFKGYDIDGGCEILEMPTAYDVDKVVEELWNLKHEYIIRDMPSGILIDAIKVVKRGGVDDSASM